MNRRILKLAVPAIINNITIPLLGLSDTSISGHLGSPAYLAAIAVGTMMINVIYWLCGFLRMGTTGLSAQAFGARDFKLCRQILFKSLTIALSISLIVLILQSPLEKLLFYVISPDKDVMDFASLYFAICIWTAPAQLAIMAISGWFIGMQNTVIPMIIAIGINIINISLSIILVFIFDLGFKGIAIGTLSANWIGLLAAILFVRVYSKRFVVENHLSSKVGWKKFFSVNTDLFFRSACIMGVSLAVTSVGSRLGETTLAANAVMMQFFIFFSYFMDGFAFAAEAIVGKAVGASDKRSQNEGVRALVKWGALMASIFFIIYAFATLPISKLITDNTNVLEMVGQMKIWIMLLPPITVCAFIFDGVYIGLARTRILLYATLIATSVFFTYIVLDGGFVSVPSNTALWTAFEIYLLLRGFLLAAEYLKLERKSLNL